MLDSKIHFLITFCKNQCLLRSTGPVDRNTMTAMVFQNPVNTRKVNVGEMLPETMNILTDFYEPFNEQLAELLGDRHYLYHLFWFQNKFQKIFSAMWRTNFVSNIRRLLSRPLYLQPFIIFDVHFLSKAFNCL